MYSSSFARFVLSCAAGVLAAGLVGCESKLDVPETWSVMGLPLGDGELRRKEEQSAKRISIDHEGVRETRKVCQRYQQTLQNSGMALTSGDRDRDTAEYIVRTLDDRGESVLLRCINAIDKTVVFIEYGATETGPRRARAGE